MNLNILFTCAGRRNYLINYFKEALNGAGRVLAADKTSMAPALAEAHVGLVFPSLDDPNYIDHLLSAIEQHKITAVISLNDHELPLLALNRMRIEASGARLLVSDEKTIDICSDKWETHKYLKNIGLNSPKSFIDFEEVKSALNKGEISFPLIMKPRWGSASIGIYSAISLEELSLAYKLQLLQIKKISNSIYSEKREEAIIFQEKLEGVEYGMDVLNDLDGNYVGSYAREKLNMRSGETDKAVSVIDDHLDEIGRSIGQNLKHLGNLDCDVFKCGNQYYVLELNPRFGGGYPFSHEAGVNTAAIYVHWLNGKKDVSEFIDYKAGVAYSKCDRMIKLS